MTRAGEKLIAAAKEAVKVAKCRHKWVRVSSRVKDRKITSAVDACDKCGCRRYTWTGTLRRNR